MQVPTKPVLKITDYTSYFSQYYLELKKYITNKIKEDKMPKNLKPLFKKYANLS